MGTSYTAVLDRIVEAETEGETADESADESETEDGGSGYVELAVLLLEADGEVVDERTVPVDRLPADAAHEGAVLEVEIADNRDEDEDGDGHEDGNGNEDEVEPSALLEVTYDPEQERHRRERAQDRFDRLSERLSDE